MARHRGRWPTGPVILEVDTWPWLDALGRRRTRRLGLADVPNDVWDELVVPGTDAVWLMGVWQRSPASRRIALEHPDLREAYDRALPDWTAADVVGSPYAVRGYTVDPALGGEDGLRAAREALARRGARLVLDFVPNHVALDSPWVERDAEMMVQAGEDDLERDPGSFVRIGKRVFAHGRDPYFPAWTDTVQLDAFRPRYRQVAIDTLRAIAERSDGVRCDMAMLLLTDVFRRTWGERAGEPPAREFWDEVVGSLHSTHPGFRFVAEAYWDLEWDLQQLGFDHCYDKRLYDRLRDGVAGPVRDHLRAGLEFQSRLLRFIENHDEPRAAATWTPTRHRLAGVLAMTLPGARLLHEGQSRGWRIRRPVQLGRRPDEPDDPALQSFYRTLLAEIGRPVFHDGVWCACDVAAASPDGGLLAHTWTGVDERRVIVVNLSERTARGVVALPWDDLAARRWVLTDPFDRSRFERDGDDLAAAGLFVELAPDRFHFLKVAGRG